MILLRIQVANMLYGFLCSKVSESDVTTAEPGEVATSNDSAALCLLIGGAVTGLLEVAARVLPLKTQRISMSAASGFNSVSDLR